jgi:hypothetical protein
MDSILGGLLNTSPAQLLSALFAGASGGAGGAGGSGSDAPSSLFGGGDSIGAGSGSGSGSGSSTLSTLVDVAQIAALFA